MRCFFILFSVLYHIHQYFFYANSPIPFHPNSAVPYPRQSVSYGDTLPQHPNYLLNAKVGHTPVFSGVTLQILEGSWPQYTDEHGVATLVVRYTEEGYVLCLEVNNAIIFFNTILF